MSMTNQLTRLCSEPGCIPDAGGVSGTLRGAFQTPPFLPRDPRALASPDRFPTHHITSVAISCPGPLGQNAPSARATLSAAACPRRACNTPHRLEARGDYFARVVAAGSTHRWASSQGLSRCIRRPKRAVSTSSSSRRLPSRPGSQPARRVLSCPTRLRHYRQGVQPRVRQSFPACKQDRIRSSLLLDRGQNRSRQQARHPHQDEPPHHV